MRLRYVSIAMLSGLLLVSVLVKAQKRVDPSPQCVVIGRGVDGLTGEIQCRETALERAPNRNSQIPAMLFRLAETYQTLSEIKAEEYYGRLVTDHCKEAVDLCGEAQNRLAALQAKNNAPRRIATPFTSDLYSFAISPDGQKLVYVATVSGKTALWLHDLNTGMAGPISGTESDGYLGPVRGAHPFWSPDGREIGFFVEGKLKRIDAAGGVAETLADAPFNYGGSWNRDGTIIFVRNNMNAVYRIVATGAGQPQRVTEPDGASVSHRFPQFLSDGRHFLFYRVDIGPGNAGENPLAIGSLDSPQVKGLQPSVRGVQAGLFAPSDQLLIVAERALFAQRLDPFSLELTGARTTISEQVADLRAAATPGYAAVSVSHSGSLAYRSKDTVRGQLAWFDRQGNRLAPLGEPEESASVAVPHFSPNGRTVAVVVVRSDGAYVRLIDAIEGTSRSSFLIDIGRFRHDTLVWSADGQSLYFPIALPGAGGIYRRPIGGTVLEPFVMPATQNEIVPASASPDGKYLLYTFAIATPNARGNFLRARPLAGGSELHLSDAATTGSGRFSPDGRWVAYEEAGPAPNEDQIRIQPFSGSPARIAFKGRTPEWSPDSKELYFVSPDNRLMAVPIGLPNTSDVIGSPTPLFKLPEGSTYTPAPDGRRFLVNSPLEAAPPIYVVSDWTRSMAPSTSNSPAQSLPAEGRESKQQIAVLDRSGNSIARVSTHDSGAGGSLTISPDGTRLATIRGSELSVTNISNNETTRLAMDAIHVPAWSGDGRELAYISDRVEADTGIFARASNAAEPARFILRAAGNGKATSLWNWSADGRFIGSTMADKLSVIPIMGNRVFIGPATGKTAMRLSPHADLVAYISNETGSNEVFIRSFDPSAPNNYNQVKISTNGAVGMIRWRADSEELYYLDQRGNVMAAPITPSPQLKGGRPVTLFRAPPGFVVDLAISDSTADVSADGQRFVFLITGQTNSR